MTPVFFAFNQFFGLIEGSCPKKMGSENAHGCHDRRTLPDVYFFVGFQGEKVNIVYFSAGFEAFKYTSKIRGLYGPGSTGGKTSGSRREWFQRLPSL